MVFFFSFAIALNAGLLFLIQPLIAKMILPWLGGSPAVWNTSLIFYQTCLLAGYSYAHLGTLSLGTRAHALLHLALILTASLLLPVALPVHWFTAPADNPVGLVLAVLTVTIGFPFFVLSAGAPSCNGGLHIPSIRQHAIPIFCMPPAMSEAWRVYSRIHLSWSLG